MARHTPNETLIRQAQEGGHAAFSELVTRSRKRLEASVRARLDSFGRRDLDVDEILQEVFLRAFESLDRLDPKDDDSFYRWLTGIARNVILQCMKRDGKTRPLDGVLGLASNDASPSRGLRREERLERLETALSGLSSDHRTVIRLARIERVPIREIAERMERSPDAVKQLLFRALAQLRHGFGDTESLHLPDRPLKVDGESDDAR